MRKYVIGVIIILALTLVNILHTPNIPIVEPTQDPNIIRIVTPKAGEVTEKEVTPYYNKFDRDATMEIDLKNHIFYIHTITEAASSAFEAYSTLMMANGVTDITINLHSPGGELDAAEVIEHQIHILQEHKIHITTTVDAQNGCMSACPIIFFAGDDRIAASNSIFMFHAPYVQLPYSASEAEIRFVEADLMVSRQKFANRLLKVCPDTPMIKMTIFDHKNHFFRADKLDTICSGIFTKVNVVKEKDVDASINNLGGNKYLK